MGLNHVEMVQFQDQNASGHYAVLMLATCSSTCKGMLCVIWSSHYTILLIAHSQCNYLHDNSYPYFRIFLRKLIEQIEILVVITLTMLKNHHNYETGGPLI